MAREFLLITDANYDGTKLEMEIKAMKKLLPYIESFSAFVASNDFYDIRNNKFLSNKRKIRSALEEGLGCSAKYQVFCKN
jgi:hypothetical protein